MNKLREKFNNQIKLCTLKLQNIFGLFLKNNINTVYNIVILIIVQGEQRKDGNKFTRQKLTQWCFGKIVQQLKINYQGMELSLLN